MNMDYCKPYAGRDTVILDRHAADTIAEDIRAFDSQLENHFAHVGAACFGTKALPLENLTVLKYQIHLSVHSYVPPDITAYSL